MPVKLEELEERSLFSNSVDQSGSLGSAVSGVYRLSWVAGVATFELAVLDLKQVEAKIKSEGGDANVKGVEVITEETRVLWLKAFRNVDEKLDEALKLSGQSVDLSSRLGMRVAMLRDEMALKKENIGA